MNVVTTITVCAVYPGPLGGGIFSGIAANGIAYRCVLEAHVSTRAPLTGEVWYIEGELAAHPQYGRQVQVSRATLERPSGQLVVDFLTTHPAFRGIGIGRRKAERLWEAFGSNLLTRLSNHEIDPLAEAGGLSRSTVERLAVRWRVVSAEIQLVRFLLDHGFEAGLAVRLLRLWPHDALARLRENPYRLLGLESWSRVDRAARHLGIPEQDPRRRAAAVGEILSRRLLSGKHTLATEVDVRSGVRALLGRRLQATALDDAIGAAIDQRIAVRNGERLQALGPAVMERALTNGFRALLGRHIDAERQRQRALLAQEVCQRVEPQPTEEQRRAVVMALTEPLSVLTGQAGTGKTTVLRVVHTACEELGIGVEQMAMAGRAAHRLREATGRDASTVAMWLYRRHEAPEGSHFPPTPLGGDRSSDDGPLDHDSLVIVDEASMVDLPQACAILNMLPRRARLLLVGDPYQLAPIGFGLVFHVLAQSPRVPQVELTIVQRQAAASGIPQIAWQIRRGIVPQLPRHGGETVGVSFDPVSREQCVDVLVNRRTSLSGEVQVLGARRRDIRAINDVLHRMQCEEQASPASRAFVAGEPVVHTGNDYERLLWNGSLGVVESVEPGGFVCRFDDREQVFTTAAASTNLELAYALTIHRAQGSQFERVIIPITPNRSLPIGCLTGPWCTRPSRVRSTRWFSSVTERRCVSQSSSPRTHSGVTSASTCDTTAT